MSCSRRSTATWPCGRGTTRNADGSSPKPTRPADGACCDRPGHLPSRPPSLPWPRPNQPPGPSRRPRPRAAGWVQPATCAARRLYGSTEARQWQPNLALAARAEQDAAAERAAMTPIPSPAVGHAPVRTFTPVVQSCPRCGGSIDFDGYCEMCGAKAPSIRDHFEGRTQPTGSPG